MSLKDPMLASAKQIVQAAKSDPSLRKGARGGGVQIMQAALIDLGYAMPLSTRKTGKPDGIYGTETVEVVAKFQHDKGLEDDGVAGKNTIAALDRALVSRGWSAPTTVAPRIRPSFSKPSFKLGHQEPNVPVDPPRLHGSKSKTVRGFLLWQHMYSFSFRGGSLLKVMIGEDCAKAVHHYLRNTGTPLEMNFRKLIKESSLSRQNYIDEFQEACKFVETLGPGNHNIVSIKPKISTAYETHNWAIAVGGFNAWAKGKAIVMEDGAGRRYELYFEYKFKDRHNYDGGKGWDLVDLDIDWFDGMENDEFREWYNDKKFIPGSDESIYVRHDELTVSDELFKRLHEEGYAKEFNTFGSFIKHVSWRDGQKLLPHQLNP